MTSFLLFASLVGLSICQTTPGGVTTPTGTTPGTGAAGGNTSVVSGGNELTTTCWCGCVDIDRKSKTTGACTADRCPDCLHDVCPSVGVMSQACSQGFVCNSASDASSVSACAKLSCGATDTCDCLSKTVECAAKQGCTIEPKLRTDCTAACPAGGATNGDVDKCTTKCKFDEAGRTRLSCSTALTANMTTSTSGGSFQRLAAAAAVGAAFVMM